MTRRCLCVLCGAIFALSGCSRAPQRPSIDEFRKFPMARGNALAGFVGMSGAASPAMITAKFGAPVQSRDSTGTALPMRTLFFKARDETGKPCLAELVFVNSCRDRSPSPDCYRLNGVAAAPE
jgi:hypothetical protein